MNYLRYSIKSTPVFCLFVLFFVLFLFCLFCFVISETLQMDCLNNKINDSLHWQNGDSSIFRRIIIPNGFYSKRFHLEESLFRRFLSRRVIIPKIFIPKGYYCEDIYPEGLLFGRVVIPNFGITTLRDKKQMQNFLKQRGAAPLHHQKSYIGLIMNFERKTGWKAQFLAPQIHFF